MWYVTEQHSAELGELGRLANDAGAEDLKHFARELARKFPASASAKWAAMGEKVCVVPIK
jgi:hypothetical protein